MLVRTLLLLLLAAPSPASAQLLASLFGGRGSKSSSQIPQHQRSEGAAITRLGGGGRQRSVGVSRKRYVKPKLTGTDKQVDRCHRAVYHPKPALSEWQKVGYVAADWRGFTGWSQYRQDHILYTEHYQLQARPGHFRGFYVDVGANAAEFISNTYFFDRCLGWRGICVEPNRHFHHNLLTHRTCELIPTCISDDASSTVEFASEGVLGGIVETNKNAINYTRTRTERMRCVDLATVFKRSNVRHVDVRAHLYSFARARHTHALNSKMLVFNDEMNV